MRPVVIVPTYNEADNIAEVVQRVRGVAPSAEVLVVDDNSPDGTADIAEAAGRELGGVHVLRRPGKAGLGPAYKAGFDWAIEHDHDVVVQMDADLSHEPERVAELLGELDGGADYAIGSRYVEGGDMPDWPWHRRALSRWANRYARGMLRLRGRDVTAGFRAIRIGLLKEIDYPSVRADGYGFLIETRYRIERTGAHGIEIPIVFRDRTLGKSKMSSRIIVEALVLVTWWGIRDRLRSLLRR